MPPFTVTDELYQHELHADAQVQFSAQNAGQPVPVVWTYTRGAGRVCYMSPGHRAESLRSPEVIKVMHTGLRWAVGLPTSASEAGR
jgi:type 1 glutamine amidotransferase